VHFGAINATVSIGASIVAPEASYFYRQIKKST